VLKIQNLCAILNQTNQEKFKNITIVMRPWMIFTSPLELIAHDNPTSVSGAATTCSPTAPFQAAEDWVGPNTASAAAARASADIQNDAVLAIFHRMGGILCTSAA
jgi:hypothetical protein